MGTTKANGVITLRHNGHCVGSSGGSASGASGAFRSWMSVINTDLFISKSQHIVKSAIPFLLFLLLYFCNELLHILPGINDLACVHIYTINNIEKFMFGCHPHRLVSSFHHPVLDFLSALPYLIHYVIPAFFPLYLLFRGCVDDIPKFFWLLGWVMWVHYVLWVVFPHTPPWVIDNIIRHNTTTTASAGSQLARSALSMQHREGCAFTRLDKAIGLKFFYNMFNSNPIPYASFPSGHVAWATVAYMTSPPGANYFAAYIGYVAWATIYSCHHHVLDALGALVVVSMTRRIILYLQDKQVCNSNYRCRATTTMACPIQLV